MNNIEDKPKRVVIAHRYFWPENVALLPLMLKEVVQLHISKGHEVTVVCGASKDFRQEWEAEFAGKVSLHFFNAKIDRQGGIFLRLFNMMRLWLLTIKTIAVTKNLAMIYLVSYPPIFAGTVLPFVRVFRNSCKTIYYLQDNHTYFLKVPLIRRMFDSYNRILLRKIDIVITLSESMKACLVDLFSFDSAHTIRSKIHVIENFSTDLQQGWNLKPKTKKTDIIYAGNYGVAQNLQHFLDILVEIKDRVSLSVEFYGDGTEKEVLKEFAIANNLSVNFNDPVSRDEISEKISMAKYGLVAAKPNLMKYANPSKLSAYNAAGTKAIVMCESESDLAKWLDHHNLGFVISPTERMLGGDQLLEILDEPEYSQCNLLETANTIFSRDKYLNNLERLIDNLFLVKRKT